MAFCENRKARFEYFLTESMTSGIVLYGTEVKAIRAGRVSIAESYITEIDGELFLVGCHIGECPNVGKAFQHEAVRNRKLLMKRKEINKLMAEINRKGITIVPTKMFGENGKIKLEVSVAKGKKQVDRREAIKTREVSREISRAMKGEKY